MTAAIPPKPTSQALVMKHLGQELDDSFALVMAARAGVAATDAFAIAALLYLLPDELATLLHTTSRTLRTYRDAKKRLNPTASEQVLKLLALARRGEEVFGETVAFRRWLNKPAYGLDNQAPLGFLQTSGGIDLVAAEVDRIAHGDLA